MMASSTTMGGGMAPVSFDTQHEDLIHDAQMDYYGRRLATASSDKTIRIFQVEPGHPEKFICSLTGHEGPVWQVAWAHPSFGSLLASCSYDGRVIIWKEEGTATGTSGRWIKAKEHKAHDSSVNAISWAPHDFGLHLACASSDGKVSTLSYSMEAGSWESKEWHAHQIGCNSVSWCPSSKPESLIIADNSGSDNSELFGELRLATGGCDNFVKIWKPTGDLVAELNGHTDWVRDVAWMPNIGLSLQTIVSCSQDRSVRVWRSKDGQNWSSELLTAEPFPDTLWRVHFSPAGNLLAVAGGDNRITMWRESSDCVWECVSNMDQASLAQK